MLAGAPGIAPSVNDLTPSECADVSYLPRPVFPVLTPLASTHHPFPHDSGLLKLNSPQRAIRDRRQHFARQSRRSSTADADDDGRHCPLEDVIAAHLTLLFLGMEIRLTHAFRGDLQ